MFRGPFGIVILFDIFFSLWFAGHGFLRTCLRFFKIFFHKLRFVREHFKNHLKGKFEWTRTSYFYKGFPVMKKWSFPRKRNTNSKDLLFESPVHPDYQVWVFFFKYFFCKDLLAKDFLCLRTCLINWSKFLKIVFKNFLAKNYEFLPKI